MDRLVEMKKTGEDDPAFGREQGGRKLPPRKSPAAGATSRRRRRPVPPTVAADNPVFTPPFLGSRVAKGIPLDDIAAYLNLTALFRNQWGYRPERDHQGVAETDAEFKERVSAVLREELDKAKAKDLLVPQVAYGYFAANAEGDDLVLWTDETRSHRARRASPSPARRRSPGCASPTSSGRSSPGSPTTPPSRSSPWGRGVSRRRPASSPRTTTRTTSSSTASGSRWPRPWPSTGTTASARSGASPTRTGPPSPGSSASSTGAAATRGATRPAPTSRTTPRWSSSSAATASASTVSDGFQMHPEQTTDAIICHHPQAKYFVA